MITRGANDNDWLVGLWGFWSTAIVVVVLRALTVLEIVVVLLLVLDPLILFEGCGNDCGIVTSFVLTSGSVIVK